jgi:hypothetical protein
LFGRSLARSEVLYAPHDDPALLSVDTKGAPTPLLELAYVNPAKQTGLEVFPIAASAGAAELQRAAIVGLRRPEHAPLAMTTDLPDGAE